MGREQVWKTLADLITEFRKKGETISSDIMEDLRAAKTMLQVHRIDPTRVENIPAIETYFAKIESYLITEANKKFGEKFADEWMSKIKQAERATAETESSESTSKFVPGLPKGQQWVRLQISEETPESEVKSLAEELGLSYKKQPDGFALVYGDGEKLKFFVKKTAEKYGGSARRRS